MDRAHAHFALEQRDEEVLKDVSGFVREVAAENGLGFLKEERPEPDGNRADSATVAFEGTGEQPVQLGNGLARLCTCSVQAVYEANRTIMRAGSWPKSGKPKRPR